MENNTEKRSRRDSIYVWILFAVMVLLALNCANTWQIKEEIHQLKEQNRQLENQISECKLTLRDEIESMQTKLAAQAEQQASLFAEREVTAALSGKQVVLQMKAIPKELNADETLSFVVETEHESFSVGASDGYSAEIRLDMIPYVQVTAVLKSETGIRQEVLEKLETAGLFSASVRSIWGEETSNAESKWGYIVWVEPGPDSDMLPFDPYEISKAEFVIHNSEIREFGNGDHADNHWEEETALSGSDYPVEDISYVFEPEFGERIPATQMSGAGMERAGFYAEMAEYRDTRRDGMRYDIYFTITMKDGTRFATPEYSVGAFSEKDEQSMVSSGDGVLLPVFE